MMGDFHLLRPLWLLALVPAALLGWALWRREDAGRAWRGVIAGHLLPHLLAGQGTRARVLPIHLLLAGWGLTTVALAGPAWRREPAPFADDTAALVVVLKVTPSMTTEDVAPTRLTRAVQKVHDLLALRPGAKAALIAYAGTAHRVMPLTRDAALIDSFAAELSPGVMPVEGDVPAEALRAASTIVEKSGQPGWVLWICDSAPPGQEEFALYRQEKGAPVSILPVVAADGPELKSVSAAADALGARVVRLTADDGDVRRLAAQTAFSEAAGAEGEDRWQDAGYWLVPLVLVIGLAWFRPGWMVRPAGGG